MILFCLVVFGEQGGTQVGDVWPPSCAHRAKVVHNLGVAANGTSTEKREALQIAQTKDKRET